MTEAQQNLEASPVRDPSILVYPQHFDEEARLQPGKKCNLKLIYAGNPDFKYTSGLILVYQWGEILSDEEAESLGRRAVAFIVCAIYDAATSAGLVCQPSEIPNGRRPAWVIEGEKMPVSLTISDIETSNRICQMSIGPMVVAIRALRTPETYREKLLAGFRDRFSDITV